MNFATLAIAIVAGVLGAFAARALVPWHRFAWTRTLFLGALGGFAGSDLSAAIVAARTAPIALTAQSAGIDLAGLLGLAGLAGLGGVVAMLVASLGAKLLRP